jgi:diguanylate cyclase (GGDEF)-like protein
MGLDVKTLYLNNVAVLFLSTATSGYLWRQYRDNTWLLWWSAGTALSGLGLLLLVVFGPSPPVAVGGPSVVLFVGGYIIGWEGIRLFNGRSPARARVAGLTLMFALILAAAIALGADLAQRASLPAAGLAICAAFSAREVARGWKDDLRRSRIGMAAIFAVMAAVLGVRSVLPWIEPASAAAESFYDPLHGMTSLVNSIGIICLSIGFIIIANERTSGRHRELALTDQLTELPTRRFFLEQAGRLGRKAQHSGVPLCVLMIDLDSFSQVNEEFGHAGGDEALMAFARLLRSLMRAADLVARYGGEEFCAVLVDADVAEGTRIAESIRARIAALPINLKGQRHRLTVSIGVANLRGDDVAAALQKADEALYQAKAQGRNQVVARQNDQHAQRFVKSAA